MSGRRPRASSIPVTTATAYPPKRNPPLSLTNLKRKGPKESRDHLRSHQRGIYALAAAAFAFFGAAFFAGAFLVAAAGALVLVTRPDFVLPRATAGFSAPTAGAAAVADLRDLPVLAFVAVFLVAGFLAVVAFFVPAALVYIKHQ